MNTPVSFRSLLALLCIILFSLYYTGCAGAEEMSAEDEMVTDTGDESVTDDQAMSEEDAISEEEQEVGEQQEVSPQSETVEQHPVQEGPSREQLQSELDNLKTENVQLKEQLSTTEQSNKDLAAKVSDLEAVNAAMKDQMTKQPVQTKVSSRTSPGKSSAQDIQAYESAVSTFNHKNYSQAINELQSVLDSGIKDDYADNCHYWIGLSYFQSKSYGPAMQHFQEVLNYKYSEKKDDAQLMIAKCFERQGNREQAQFEYKKLIDLYPTSEFVGIARAKVR